MTSKTLARDCKLKQWGQSAVAVNDADARVCTCNDIQQRRIMSSLMPAAAAVIESNSVIVWNSNAGCGGGPRMRTRQPIACNREIRLRKAMLAPAVSPCVRDAPLNHLAWTARRARCGQCRGHTCKTYFSMDVLDWCRGLSGRLLEVVRWRHDA